MQDDRILILLRHATADSAPGDHARPLSATGRQEARRLAESWPAWLPWPELALCSDARRTQETLAPLRELRTLPTETEARLYLGSSEAMLERVQELASAMRTVLLVGHNPGIHELALTLAPRMAQRGEHPLLGFLAQGFAPAGLCALALPGRMSWAELREHEARIVGLHETARGWLL